jgi:flagellin-specific chaperone FliS
MLALTDPHEAYRVSEFDARLNGARPAELVTFCLGQVIQGVGSAISAHELGRSAARSKALTRALTALTALEMGVDRDAPLAAALLQIYGSARRALLDCALDFNPETLATIRADFREILAALAPQP